MALNNKIKQEILRSAKEWFKTIIATNHIKNTIKLTNPKLLDINPFIISYLSKILTGNVSAIGIARSLVYPRALSTSITTSFGMQLQKFIPCLREVLGNNATGSITQGMDIEFIDQLDNKKKYCQLKAGPNTINKDDVTTIHNYFKKARNLAKTNKVPLSSADFIVGVLYGERKKLSSHYKNLEKEHGYDVFIGQEFWHRLTGDEGFYYELGNAISSVAEELIDDDLLENTILELSKNEFIKKLAGNR